MRNEDKEVNTEIDFAINLVLNRSEILEGGNSATLLNNLDALET
jgi:hypothetical protein